MGENRAFQHIPLENIRTRNHPIIVASPNYEERSLRCPSEFAATMKDKEYYAVSLELTGTQSKDVLLEKLNCSHRRKLEEVWKTCPSTKKVLCHYPDEFRPEALNIRLYNSLVNLVVNHHCEGILFDISTMPHRVTMVICTVTKKLLAEFPDKLSIFFAETRPKQYATVPYAQEIGMLEGLRSGPALREHLANHLVVSFVFPSRTGFEAPLVLKELHGTCDLAEMHLFVPIFRKGLLGSMEVMRANSSLLMKDNVVQHYYRSMADGANLLIDTLRSAATTYDKRQPLMLVGSFAYKIHSVASAFAFENSPFASKTEIEMCRLSGFQYTPVYSIGSKAPYVCQLCL